MIRRRFAPPAHGGPPIDGGSIDGRSIDGGLIDGRSIDGRDSAGMAVDGSVRRKLLGQWYTPAALVEHLVDAIARVHGRRPLAVLDPACGDGRFLAAVRAHFGGAVRLVGVDVDEVAVAAARHAIPGADIRLGDALAEDVAAGLIGEGFDVVVGNPPFLGQMSRATTRGGRSRHGGGPYADTAAEFLALAARAVAPADGTVALVMPQSILSSRDAGPIREEVAERLSVAHAWWSTRRMFEAHVHVCALVLRAGPPPDAVSRARGPDFAPVPTLHGHGTWARLLVDRPSDAAAPTPAVGGPTLGDVADFAIDFRDQYYGLVDAVSDDGPGAPLVTSGLIDPATCFWGQRPARFAKRTYAAPRVDLSRLDARMRRWADRRLVPKVLVANQTSSIEAVVDADGAWLPSVPVLTCTPRSGGPSLEELRAALSAPPSTAWVRERAAGSGLSPGAVRLTPSLLASVPWPSDVPRTGGG